MTAFPYRRVVLAVAGATLLAPIRRLSLAWGTRTDETKRRLPGDELLARADLCATRAITIRATAEEIWPWIAQLGQGRGGFYSYDLIENLVGCDIHSADRIVPEWQNIAVGDEVKLQPDGGLTAVRVDPARALVLRGGVPARLKTPPPYDFTWAFVLCPASNRTTRLVVRERYSYARRWVAAIVEPVELVSFVMSRQMLRGIRKRAERARIS